MSASYSCVYFAISLGNGYYSVQVIWRILRRSLGRSDILLCQLHQAPSLNVWPNGMFEVGQASTLNNDGAFSFIGWKLKQEPCLREQQPETLATIEIDVVKTRPRPAKDLMTAASEKRFHFRITKVQNHYVHP